ncbi:hypothetical protein [Acutalibacter intestini]|uniref:hypothetical protein n=1 Tax=Acutalibacter intestini TaxID=3093659 RepID=UPI002AC97ACC|nr:hypothetical protein [Acutalibacter sp. M00204]
MIIDVIGGLLTNKVFFDIAKPKAHESKKSIYEKNLFYSDRVAWEKRLDMQHLKGCMRIFYFGSSSGDFWWTYDQICLIMSRLKNNKFPFDLEYYNFKKHSLVTCKNPTLDKAESFILDSSPISIDGYLRSDKGEVLKEVSMFISKFPNNLRSIWQQGKIVIDNIEMAFAEADNHISEEWKRMNETWD